LEFVPADAETPPPLPPPPDDWQGARPLLVAIAGNGAGGREIGYAMPFYHFRFIDDGGCVADGDEQRCADISPR
jgi:hypothetical protein